MRRAALAALAVVAAAGLAGCGSRGVIQARPQTVVGSVPTVTSPAQGGEAGGSGGASVPAAKLKGDPAKGKPIFMSKGCVSCHTLKAANATGTVGPNLDELKPSFEAATFRITNGGGQMPAFKDQLSAQQIADVAAFVVKSTGGQTP